MPGRSATGVALAGPGDDDDMLVSGLRAGVDGQDGVAGPQVAGPTHPSRAGYDLAAGDADGPVGPPLPALPAPGERLQQDQVARVAEAAAPVGDRPVADPAGVGVGAGDAGRQALADDAGDLQPAGLGQDV